MLPLPPLAAGSCDTEADVDIIDFFLAADDAPPPSPARRALVEVIRSGQKLDSILLITIQYKNVGFFQSCIAVQN